MLPPTSKFSWIIRKLFGDLLDYLLFLDYLSAKLICLTGKKSESIELIPNSRVVFYSAYLSSEEEYKIVQRHVNFELKDFDKTFLINTGSFVPTLDIFPNLIVFNRINRGRDFGSLRDIIQKCGSSLGNVSEILILNDSIYWKPGNLQDYVSFARNSEFRVTGLTCSYQHNFHLQSFALHFKTIDVHILKALSSIYTFRAKRTIVKYGEKRLSSSLKKAGVTIGSKFNPRVMQLNVKNYSSWYGKDLEGILALTDQGTALNPTIHFWPELALSAGVIKKSLLKNPAKFSQSPARNKKLMELLAEWGVTIS